MTTTAPDANETAFTMDTSAIKYGPGVTAEVGSDLRMRGVRRAMLMTDPNLMASDAVATAERSMREAGVDVVRYDSVRVEPTDRSFLDAIDAAKESNVDGFVAVGGGSVIDTAKAANLYATYPADLLTYVNKPIGDGAPVPGPLKPLIAVPTTAGTGSETTGVAIFDLTSMHAKTGIAHRALRPALGVLDPLNTVSMPAMVTACSALDILSHAIESYTAMPYSARPRPESPELRPAYQGANPISDQWATAAMALVARHLPTVIAEPEDLEARRQMMLAAAYAGIGFGNAGVHLPHGMSYPVSGLVRSYKPDGYEVEGPLVPHGMSVILNAPAVFRFTAPVDPGRHREAARLLGADVSDVDDDAAGEALAGELIRIMRETGMPSGLAEIGFTEDDLDALVAGTVPQHRVTKLSPRPASEADLRALFQDAMRYW